MSSYVRSISFKTTFDGDEVTARIRPITRADALTLGPLASEVPDATTLKADPLAALPAMTKLVTECAPLLPKYVTEFAGLKDAAGTPVGLDEVCEQVCFTELVVELATALLRTAEIPNSRASVSH